MKGRTVMESNVSVSKSLAEALRAVRAEAARLATLEKNISELLKGTTVEAPIPVTVVQEAPAKPLGTSVRPKRNMRHGGNTVMWPKIAEAMRTYDDPLTSKQLSILMGVPHSTIAHYLMKNKRKLIHKGHKIGYVLAK